MPISIMCPNLACRAILRVPDKVRGKKVRCGECSIVFSVPENTPETKTQSASGAAEAPSK